jgi:hypothetical protein
MEPRPIGVLPFGHRSPVPIAGYVIALLPAPLLFALRFAVLAPVSWIVRRCAGS